MPLIRSAKLSDADRLTTLSFHSKAYWGYSPEFMEACREELKISAETINSYPHYILEHENRVIGFYALRVLNSAEIELEALFVDPAFIRLGNGRLLIEDAKKNARALGASNMIIQGDPNAKQFYLAAGGILTGERESESVPGRYLPTFSINLSI